MCFLVVIIFFFYIVYVYNISSPDEMKGRQRDIPLGILYEGCRRVYLNKEK